MLFIKLENTFTKYQAVTVVNTEIKQVAQKYFIKYK